MELFETSKLLSHLDTLAKWKNTGWVNPLLIEIDLTNKCNHHCPQCSYGFARNNSSLSLHEIESILHQAHSLGTMAVVFTGGGEPLLNSQALRAIEIADSKGIEVGLITNGHGISREVADFLVAKCTWVRVSLDAANKDQYASTHGVSPQQWGHTINHIENLVASAVAIQSSTTVGLGYLVDEESMEQVLPAIALAQSLGVGYIQLRPYRNTKVDLDAIQALTRTRRTSSSTTKVLVSKSRFMHTGTARPFSVCRATGFVAAVGSDFRLYPCCDTKYQPESVLGDLRSNSLEDIWWGSAREQHGRIFAFCPHPCRHNANNILLEEISSEAPHRYFV